MIALVRTWVLDPCGTEIHGATWVEAAAEWQQHTDTTGCRCYSARPPHVLRAAAPAPRRAPTQLELCLEAPRGA